MELYDEQGYYDIIQTHQIIHALSHSYNNIIGRCETDNELYMNSVYMSCANETIQYSTECDYDPWLIVQIKFFNFPQ